MANFFGKPKPNIATSRKPASVASGPSSVQSEFEKTFKPFVVKKDVQLAPINPFKKARGARARIASGSQHDVIVVDDDEDELEVENSRYSTRGKFSTTLNEVKLICRVH
jgi:chromatin assembly factor 1 subunit A